jgi:GNAT superfamily N-acetyltransferase
MELIQEGFRGWQSWKGRRALAAFRVLSRFRPCLWALERFSAEFRNFCSAIVWVNEGRVVGVIAGHPIGPDPRYWIFKNISVKKSYRRAGIGRALQIALIARAINQGAEKAIVMVRNNNVESINLCRSTGYKELIVTLEMNLPAIGTVKPIILPGVALRHLSSADRHKIHELAQSITPLALQAFAPIRQDELLKTASQRLWNLFTGHWVHRMAVEEGNKLVAVLTVEALLFGGEHRLKMMVHPRWRGRLEEMLITKALSMLKRYPKGNIGINLLASHTEAIEALRAHGFVEKKTQMILGLDLHSSQLPVQTQASASTSLHATGPHPMVPKRHLCSVIELINEGFHGWQSWKGEKALFAFKVLTRLGPCLWVLERINTEFRDFCSAIVWVEEGQVVGVIAGHPIGSDPRYWIFRNLAVRKSYRTAGIGRALLKELIHWAKGQGAIRAIGMVRTKNPASLHLCRSLGFKELTVTVEMNLAAMGSVKPFVLPGVTLHRLNAVDRHKGYELAQTIFPAALQSFRPIQEDEFHQTACQKLGDLFTGHWVHRIAAKKEDEFVGLLTVEALLFGGEHRLKMMVHPHWRGRLEKPLIAKGLSILARYPKGNVYINLFASHTEAIEVLSEFGFVEKKTQIILGLDLQSPGDGQRQ